MKKKLYIGCALTIIPEDKRDIFLKIISDLKKALEENFEIIEFLGVTTFSLANPKEVYNHDIHECAMKADAMLAICDYPSLGLGYEMATAIEKRGIPVLAVAHTDSKVTNLVIGIQHPQFNFLRYESVEEIINYVQKTLTK
ncbi:MAG: hypothetical protein AAB895_02550 [Patescibacteria group bacterium]